MITWPERRPLLPDIICVMATKSRERPGTVSTDDWSREASQLWDHLGAKNDHAAVILGTAWVEEMLYRLLASSLLLDNNRQAALFDGPLRTFSAKLNVAYYARIIDETMRSALDDVADIRNTFAHDLQVSGLDDPAFKGRIGTLVGRFDARQREQIKKAAGKKNKGFSVEGLRFRSAVWLLAQILQRHEMIARMSPGEICSLHGR